MEDDSGRRSCCRQSMLQQPLRGRPMGAFGLVWSLIAATKPGRIALVVLHAWRNEEAGNTAVPELVLNVDRTILGEVHGDICDRS